MSRRYADAIGEISRLAVELAGSYQDVKDPRQQLRTIRILADLAAEYDEAIQACLALSSKASSPWTSSKVEEVRRVAHQIVQARAEGRHMDPGLTELVDQLAWALTLGEDQS